jgi:hypothetical protein
MSERGRELRRRRHRKKKMAVLERKLQKSTVSERAVIVEKIRSLTPGAEYVIENLGLTER